VNQEDGYYKTYL